MWIRHRARQHSLFKHFHILARTWATHGLQRHKALNGQLKIGHQLIGKRGQHIRLNTTPAALRRKFGRGSDRHQFADIV
ncbi:Uncharacterised protein [Vibrio cholerae]|nr:Uncharacterised protein [Vibrio cholerae]CSI53904.1 Uncharacterised protein [Vibrio cholerae]